MEEELNTQPFSKESQTDDDKHVKRKKKRKRKQEESSHESDQCKSSKHKKRKKRHTKERHCLDVSNPQLLKSDKQYPMQEPKLESRWDHDGNNTCTDDQVSEHGGVRPASLSIKQDSDMFSSLAEAAACGMDVHIEGQSSRTFPPPPNVNVSDEHSNDQKDHMVFKILAKYGMRSTHYRKMLKELQDKGLSVSKGRWQESEINQLRLNWENYKIRHPEISDPESVLCPFKYEDSKKAKKLSRQTFLAESLAHKIKRAHVIVLIRAQKTFIDWNVGRFSQEDFETIVRLQKSGMGWSKISNHVNRNPINISVKYREGKFGNCAKGPWSRKEDRDLLKVMKTCIEYDDIRNKDVYKWPQISQKMKTDRTPYQCRIRYSNTLMWKELRQSQHRPDFSTEDKIRLIEGVIEENVAAESEIDWTKLASGHYNVSSASFLVSKWRILVRSKVPDYNRKSFDEITDYLAQVELPRLQRRLQRKLKRISEKEARKRGDSETQVKDEPEDN